MWVFVALAWGFCATVIIIAYPILESSDDISSILKKMCGNPKSRPHLNPNPNLTPTLTLGAAARPKHDASNEQRRSLGPDALVTRSSASRSSYRQPHHILPLRGARSVTA